MGKELGNETLIAWQLMGLAKVAVAKAQLTYATRLYSAAEAKYDVNKELSPKSLKTMSERLDACVLNWASKYLQQHGTKAA